MTQLDCEILANQLVTNGRVGTQIDTSSLYHDTKYGNDVFRWVRTGERIYCERGFDERYGRPASRDGDPASQYGQYPTYQDLNNIFHIGVDHGMMRSLGMPTLWEAGRQYPHKSVVYDEDGNRFISRSDYNDFPLPKKGEKSTRWVPVKAIPSFAKSGIHTTVRWNSLRLRSR